MNATAAKTERPVRILAVDDHEPNLELLQELLEGWGYEVILARDGRNALSAVKLAPFDLIILDIMMPKLDGFEVCRRLKEDRRTRYIPVVMLTALSGTADKVKALEAGADDFLNKPVHKAELRARVKSLVRIKQLRDDLDTAESVLTTLVSALEKKDPLTAGHTARVAAHALRLAGALGLPERDREVVRMGALLHDLGKIGIPEAILFKESPFDVAEMEIYRNHPALGAAILAPLKTLRGALPMIRHHHEQWDGSGFPDHLKGEEIPLFARIVGIANEFDDLLYSLHQERAASPQEALDQLARRAEAGLIDPQLARVFIAASAPGKEDRGGDWDDGSIPELYDHTAVPQTILVIDDTPRNLEFFTALLTENGYRVITAENGSNGLRLALEASVDLVLVDVMLPDIDGMEICRRIKAQPATEFLPVILVTALSGQEERREGILSGADDFLPAPVNTHELLARIRSLLRLKTYHSDLEQSQNILISLALTLEAKDPYTRGHSQRVGDLASRLGQFVGVPAPDCEKLRTAGLLHDIGKIGVSERLLNKPAALSREEFITILSHPVMGADICSPLKSVRDILPMIRHHHERYNGQGYPDGLAGDRIPLGARILSLADAYDALTSERSYRECLSSTTAFEILHAEEHRGKWDPSLLTALETMLTSRPDA